MAKTYYTGTPGDKYRMMSSLWLQASSMWVHMAISFHALSLPQSEPAGRRQPPSKPQRNSPKPSGSAPRRRRRRTPQSEIQHRQRRVASVLENLVELRRRFRTSSEFQVGLPAQVLRPEFGGGLVARRSLQLFNRLSRPVGALAPNFSRQPALATWRARFPDALDETGLLRVLLAQPGDA